MSFCALLGLPETVVCTTVNKVCASGLKSIALGAQSIALGHSNVVIAGGMESMSNVPFYVPKMRDGCAVGHQSLLDGLLIDGLVDPTYGIHMGECGEEISSKYSISRKEQDEYAMLSYKRAQEATKVKIKNTL
jgi:acetyl-CoA C-acetyltransferase